MEFMCLDKYIFTMDLPEIQFFMCSACLYCIVCGLTPFQI